MIIDRILKIIELYNENKSIFYKKTGLSNGFLDKVKDIGVSKLEYILKVYPEINPIWLLTGEGNIYVKEANVTAEPIKIKRKTNDPVKESQSIPVFNLEATMGLIPVINGNGIDEEKIVDHIVIPNLPSCDGAITATGDSMYPILKAGDLVAFKKIDLDIRNIFFGEIYILSILIDSTSTYKTIKYVHKSDKGPEYLKLVSQNQHWDPVDIHINQISAIGLVRASIRIHN